jgi:hypothetical protein
VDDNGKVLSALGNDSEKPNENAEPLSTPPQNLNSSEGPAPACAPTPPSSSNQSNLGGNGAVGICSEDAEGIRTYRKDKRHLHTTRHAVFSKYPLQALARLGENVRHLRTLERLLRAELKPSGTLGAILFDRLWSSYLRCLLAARAEAVALTPKSRPDESPGSTPVLREDTLPTLVWKEHTSESDVFSSDLFRQLVLVERYDRHFSREMFRALAMLLVLRSGGEPRLGQCIEKNFGLGNDRLEGAKDE